METIAKRKPVAERRWLAAVFCIALVLCALVTKSHTLSWNDASRLATIDALAQQHTAAIERSRFAATTQDKYPYRGHVYSDKPPALALQGAVVAAIAEPFGITFERQPQGTIWLVTVLSVGLWFAIGVTYVYAFARLLGADRPRAALSAALSGCATLALPYATVLANHVPAGAAALAGVYHLVRGRNGDGFHLAVAALYSTLAVAFDAGIVVIVVCPLVLLWGRPARVWLTFLAWCVPIAVAQAAFNVTVSGAPGPPAMNHNSWDASSPFHREDPSPMFFAAPWGYVAYAGYVIVGAKGLFTYTPLSVLCAYGLVTMIRDRGIRRRIAVAVAAAVVLYVVLVVAFTNDYGAVNYGQRRYADIALLLGVGLAPALEHLTSRAWSALARGVAVYSLFVAGLGVIDPFAGGRGSEGIAAGIGEFERLAHRAPVQAAIDVAALALMIFFVLRLWSTPAVPIRGTVRRAAAPPS